MEAKAEVKIDPERAFRVTLVEKCGPPHGERTGRWHRYVVQNELTVIRGYARGSKKEVMEHAATYVEQLNAKNDPARKLGPGRSPKRIQRPPPVRK